jgi:hypothetical protein
VNVTGGIWLIIVGATIGLLAALVFWKRLPAPIVVPVLVAAGVSIGAGALLVQDHAGPVDWAVTLVVLGALAPWHVRIVFGPSGGGERSRVVAEEPPAA